jgi:hypothetical protein
MTSETSALEFNGPTLNGTAASFGNLQAAFKDRNIDAADLNELQKGFDEGLGGKVVYESSKKTVKTLTTNILNRYFPTSKLPANAS